MQNYVQLDMKRLTLYKLSKRVKISAESFPFLPFSHDTAPTEQNILPWLKLFEKRYYIREKKDFPDFLCILGIMGHM